MAQIPKGGSEEGANGSREYVKPENEPERHIQAADDQ
jgi:hypothetical protein